MRTPIIMADPQTTTEVWGWVRQHLLAQKPAEDSLHMLRNAHERAAIFEGGMRMMERLVVPCEEHHEGPVEFAVWEGEEFDEFVAQVNGPRDTAMQEARRYAFQCLHDGRPAQIEEVTRKTVETMRVTSTEER